MTGVQGVTGKPLGTTLFETILCKNTKLFQSTEHFFSARMELPQNAVIHLFGNGLTGSLRQILGTGRHEIGTDTLKLFATFYADFDQAKAESLLVDLQLDKNMRLSKMSKGMKEKVQLVLVMSRKAKIYILDEPLGGVDPASRDYILNTILKHFDKDATLLISTHMIADIEKILDEVIFIENGTIILHEAAEALREKEKASIDEIFRRKFYVR